jgi:hypothetical protein
VDREPRGERGGKTLCGESARLQRSTGDQSERGSDVKRDVRSLILAGRWQVCASLATQDGTPTLTACGLRGGQSKCRRAAHLAVPELSGPEGATRLRSPDERDAGPATARARRGDCRRRQPAVPASTLACWSDGSSSTSYLWGHAPGHEGATARLTTVRNTDSASWSKWGASRLERSPRTRYPLPTIGRNGGPRLTDSALAGTSHPPHLPHKQGTVRRVV